jgi:acyl-CoA synthetase (AMP-forming)/AMP-acid ligase II
MQVSPIEIENTLLAHPAKLITDASVAGVSGGRTSDERIPRAWVVLSSAGAALGDKEVVAQLVGWVEEQLSRYKWLRGGIGIVEAASVFFYSCFMGGCTDRAFG